MPIALSRARLHTAACLVFAFTFAAMTSPALAGKAPNVLIMLADDLGWADVGYHGGPIETPGIDRLAREGVQFDRFYVTPICSPTRAALVTGRDPMKLGIAYDQLHPWYNAGLPTGEQTLATAFAAAGYQTGLVGKWHLGHTQAQQLPGAHGFQHFHGHLHTNTDYFQHEREGGHDLQQNGKSIFRKGEYLTHIQAREAKRFIEERDPERPFLLYVPFTAPHGPCRLRRRPSSATPICPPRATGGSTPPWSTRWTWPSAESSRHSTRRASPTTRWCSSSATMAASAASAPAIRRCAERRGRPSRAASACPP